MTAENPRAISQAPKTSGSKAISAATTSLSFNILQLLVISIVVGLATLKVGDKAEPFLAFVRSLLAVVRAILGWIIRLTPIGSAALIGTAIATYGWSALAQLGVFTAAIYLGLALVLLVVYPTLLLANGLRPGPFFAKAWPAIQLGFVSRSSVGTLPVTETVTERMGVDKGYAAFAIPLASTTKMDGCASIYPALAAIFVAGFYGIPKAERRSEELLEAVRLSDKRDAYARTLSGGMKRRLLIAKAMVHSPPILVLDEPTAGVDVELRRQLWELVTELNEQGVTIVLTTHYLEEAEELCERIAIINHGELIANKPTRELIGMAREKIVSVSVDKDLAGPIMEEAFVKSEVVDPRRLDVTYDRDATTAGQVLSLIQQHGYAIEDVTTREADLEDVFVQLTAAV